MKKLLLISASVLAFAVFVACKKDVVMSARSNFRPHHMVLDTTYSTKSAPSKVITSTKDTLVITAITTTTVKITYDTVIHKYVAPVPPPYKRPKYKVSGKLSYYSLSNLTISLDSINSALGNVNQITVSNCSNVHITKCYLTNTTGFAITLNNCTNVLVDSCVFNKVAFGVYANGGTGIKVNNNQGVNRYDVGNTGGQRSHWVQFGKVYGGGNQINYNRFEDVTGQALHPHDGISVWYSNGKIGDSIQVIGNWLRGGQQYAWPTSGDTGVGITISDASGNYQVARGNIVANCGYEGIICYSNGYGIKVDHNSIFCSGGGIALVGAAIGNSNQIYYGYNRVNWTNSNGVNGIYNGSTQYWLPSTTPTPVDWNKNTWQDKTLTSSILPATIITWK